MQLHDTFVWMGAVVTSARSAEGGFLPTFPMGAISAHIPCGNGAARIVLLQLPSWLRGSSGQLVPLFTQPWRVLSRGTGQRQQHTQCPASR